MEDLNDKWILIQLFDKAKPPSAFTSHREALKYSHDFREQLIYYNTYICSLVYTPPYFGTLLQYFGHHRQPFNLTDLDPLPYRFPQHPYFDIYLEERQKEIDRLTHLLSSTTTYAERLRCYQEEKVTAYRFDELRVDGNDYLRYLASGGTPRLRIHFNHHPVIDLTPGSPDECRTYNLHLRHHIEQIAADILNTEWKKERGYRSYIVEQDQLHRELEKALDKESTINFKLQKIEERFNVCSISNFKQVLYSQTYQKPARWESAIFHGFIHGHEFDYSLKQLTKADVLSLIRVEQYFRLYKYLWNQKNSHTGFPLTTPDNSLPQSERKLSLHQTEPTGSLWLGSSEQKNILYSELVENEYIDDSPENKSNFLNNKIVKWKGTGRLLFYLIQKLRFKPYKLLPEALEIVPFIRHNFTKKNGNEFQHVHQNKSGMENTNKDGKPKSHDTIDNILQKLQNT